MTHTTILHPFIQTAMIFIRKFIMISRPRKPVDILAASLLIFLFLFTSCVHLEKPLQESYPAWQFTVLSDTQDDNRKKTDKTCINDTVIHAITEDILREKPDLVIVTGDLVNGWFRNGGTDYDTQYTNWKKAMGTVYASGIQVYPIRGNHDSGPERLALPPLPAYLEPPPDTLILLKESFRKHFQEVYIPKNGPAGEEGLTYSFIHKNAFFVGLDQYAGGQHRINQTWLDDELAENFRPHVFIYGHEPAFGADHRDNLGFYPNDRDIFWNAIGSAGTGIYFCGHDHFYNRALVHDEAGNAIRQIIAGTGGGVLRKWSGIYEHGERVQGEYHNENYHGYVLVTVDGMMVTVTWKAFIKRNETVSWQILDTFTYTVPLK